MFTKVVLQNNREQRSLKRTLLVSLILRTCYSAPVFSNAPIRFSDIGVISLLTIALQLPNKRDNAKVTYAAILLIGWATINTLLHGANDSQFNLGNAAASLIKLTSCIVALLSAYRIGRNTSIATIEDCLKKFILFHCIILLLYVTLHKTGMADGFFKIVTPGPERNALIANNKNLENHFRIIILDGDSFRYSGIFEEPAWFGWSISLALAFLCQIENSKSRRKLTIISWLVIGSAYAWSRSVTALISLSLIAAIRFNAHKRILALVAFTTAAGLFLAFSFISNDGPESRLAQIAAGSDGSSSNRIIGSINGAWSSLINSPLTGTGLGDTNRHQAYTRYLDRNTASGIYHPISGLILDMHNVVLAVLSALGLPGLITFILLFSHGIKSYRPILSTGFILAALSSNVFDHAYIYAILGLSIATLKNCKQRQIHKPLDNKT